MTQKTRARRPSRLLGSFGANGENFRRRPKNVKTKKETDPRRSAVVRIRAAGIVLSILGLSILGRAWQLQILAGSRYDDAARRQALTSARITAKRGVIKDRNGAELALSVDVDSVYAEPRRLEGSPAAAAKKIAPILGLDAKKLERRLSADRAFLYLKRRVGPEVAAKIRELGLDGIGVKPEPQRFYPTRELAAHVLGFIDAEGQGKSGVEKTFDPFLRGRSYEVPGLRDALGNRAFVEGFVPQAVLEGDDLILTLDRHIQHTAEIELERTVREQSAAAGVAIVMRPASGDILALASYPAYNPNNLRASSAEQHLNRAVSAVYEPGSTIKMITIGGALADGRIHGEERIDCENGQWTVGGRTIGDSQHRYGVLGIADVMKHSSNICAAKIGLRLGAERLHHWLFAFGLGQKTGVELPGELPGLIREPSTWREIELANISFGQGLSVTPLQIAQAASVIANGGLWVEPRLFAAKVDKAGREERRPGSASKRVLEADAAERVRAMLSEVTEKGGTAEGAAIPGFRVAGKTGTAQKIDPVTKAYSRALYVASFVGFVPAERPEVLVLVLVDEPKRAIYGGQVAAPAFKRIAAAALSALSVFPEDGAARDAFLASFRPPPPLASDLPLEVALSARAQELLDAAPELALGRAAPVAALFERTLSPAEIDLVPARKGSLKMPNFAGLGLREVLNRSAEVHCDLVLRGTGRVVRQTPRAGATLAAGERCELELAPNG